MAVEKNRSFSCNLGSVDHSIEERLRTEWAPTQCEHFAAGRDPNGDLLVRVTKKGEARHAKSHKLSLQNLAQNWKTKFAIREFKLAGETAVGESATTPCQSSASTASISPAAKTPPNRLQRRIVSSLPDDFDTLAQEKYDREIARRRAILAQ